jgi:hypothetical protein
MTIGREKSIFLDAIDLESDSERQAYLSEACGDDRALRQAVDELLAAHERSINVVDQQQVPPADFRKEWDNASADLIGGVSSDAAARKFEPDDERIGRQIGPYKLLEKLGEGGFGQVYVAEQEKPLRRRVALKLLKPGMGSREFVARFEAERQALAMMDHPHIARVFDAGETSAGQPYFVIELVRGVPITRFCQERRLSIRERLTLFSDVCEAVQHAHQKGIIHRDLKPSNVLVTLHDTRAVVKVIDFGVAKALGEPLTDKTIYTRFTQMIGTPMYMSPEQAEMNAFAVDTRSDVYSLGILLYELLSGTTPLDQTRLNTVTFDELRRIIREEEPPRPSAKLSTLSAMDSTLSTQRRLERQAEANMLRGELDWVVMKALEKDRRRRYESAAELARDVQRYLNQQPVVARPPTPWYRLRKFAQRNKVMFAATSLVALSLIAGTAVSTWQAVRATRAYAEAELLRKDAVDSANRLKEANVLLDSARANADEQRWALALTQYTRAAELKPDHYLTWSGRGSLYARMGAWRSAAADFAVALKLGAPANNPGWWGVPQLCVHADDHESYQLACEALRKQITDNEDSALSMMVARGLLVGPSNREEARMLAKRMEQLVEHQPRSRNWRGPLPGPDASLPNGPPMRDRPGPAGPPPGGEFLRPLGLPLQVQWYAAGLAHFRAGEFGKALEFLQRAAKSESWLPHSRLALPVLAMTNHAMGQQVEAEAALADAETVLDKWLSALENNDLSQPSLPWFDIVECVILYHEAHELIRGSRPPDDGRLEKLERNALALLHGESAR